MDWVCGAVNDEKEDEYKEKMTLTGANNIKKKNEVRGGNWDRK